MKYLNLAILLSLFLYSCSEGTSIVEPAEEFTVSQAVVTGVVKCSNEAPLAGLQVTLSDEQGVVATTLTNDSGEYNFHDLNEGNYELSFSGGSNYSYSSQEYDAILDKLEKIILGWTEATWHDRIAYDLANAGENLTSLDIVTFQRLQSGEMGFAEIDRPWRYISQENLESGNVTISDRVEFEIVGTANEQLDIVGVYHGDPSGETCDGELSTNDLSYASGKLTCVNDGGIADVQIQLADQFGNVKTATTNSDGEYFFDEIESGIYTMSFSGQSSYLYSSEEYKSIAETLWDLILAVNPSDFKDKIAYHMVGAENGLTTLDLYYWQKLQNGESNFSEVEMPWRYLTKSDFDSGNDNINDEIVISISENMLDLDLVAIYFGDPDGEFCN